jgi:hypothetical protein
VYPLDRSLLPRTNRDVRDVHERLIDPKTYTIIAACGLHEIASEMNDGGGALTYFLLCALKTCAGNMRVQALYDHLRLKFHIYRPQQTPVCYGRTHFSFFGDLQPEDTHRKITVLKAKGTFSLGAGQAHGVRKGDEYALYPLKLLKESESETSREIAPLQAEVHEVSATTSQLKLTQDLSPNASNISQWFAKLIGLPSWCCAVRLPSTVSTEVEQWKAAMANKRFIIPLSDEDSESDNVFQIAKVEVAQCSISGQMHMHTLSDFTGSCCMASQVHNRAKDHRATGSPLDTAKRTPVRGNTF